MHECLKMELLFFAFVLRPVSPSTLRLCLINLHKIFNGKFEQTENINKLFNPKHHSNEPWQCPTILFNQYNIHNIGQAKKMGGGGICSTHTNDNSKYEHILQNDFLQHRDTQYMGLPT